MNNLNIFVLVIVSFTLGIVLQAQLDKNQCPDLTTVKQAQENIKLQQEKINLDCGALTNKCDKIFDAICIKQGIDPYDCTCDLNANCSKIR